MRQKTVNLVNLGLALILSVVGCAASANAQEFRRVENEVKNLIVRVRAGQGTNQETAGAGILVSVQADSLYLVTAYHVISHSPKHIEVECAFLPDAPVEADYLSSDSRLDLAMLRISLPHSPLRTVRVTLPFQHLQPGAAVQRYDAVHPVGHPLGAAWYIPTEASTVSQTIAERIRFEPECSPGYSGGGLFDDHGRLLGMIVRGHTIWCEALSFERICQTLEGEWGLTVKRQAFEWRPVEPAEQRIEDLLAKAGAYCQRKWYTTPATTNAFAVYQQVLALDPENSEALAGIRQMLYFYKSHAEQAEQQGKVDKALRYYAGYLQIAPNDDEVLDKVSALKNPPPTPLPTAVPTIRPTPVPTPRSCWDNHTAGATCQEPVTGIEFVWIPEGCFQMGQTEAEKRTLIKKWSQETYQKYFADELPRHKVCLDGFWLGRYEVTNAQYRYWKRDHDSGKYKGHALTGDDQPVVMVSWEDARNFAEWLTGQNTGTPRFRLPTEAEWEYAARAGTTTSRFWGDKQADACQYANVGDLACENAFLDAVEEWKRLYIWRRHDCHDGDAVAAPVGTFRPNTFNLYDMLGNVWEWCQDDYHVSYEGTPGDGSAWTEDSERSLKLLRGGSWYNSPRYVRSAYRLRNAPDGRVYDIGFRVVASSRTL